MRDVVTGFYCAVLRSLIEKGQISTTDSVLVVCGGELDEKVAGMVGFSGAVITGMEGDVACQNAENLTYDDGSFDVVIVHAGLHHCYSPHRALLEMYRVSRKAVVAFEARDSLLSRIASRMSLTEQYELSSVTSNGCGGVAESGIPNFVYRWTERDVKKAIASYDPMRMPSVQFFYDLRLPIQRFTGSGWRLLRMTALMIEPLSGLFAKLLPSQCNEFAFAIFKDGERHAWIKARAGSGS